MQVIPPCDKPLPLNALVSHRNLTTIQFSNKLNPHYDGRFKIIDGPTEVTYESLTQVKKSFHKFTHIEFN